MMTVERRYTEKEIAAIFRKASEAQEKTKSQLGHSDGLTLADLQEIGREAGISPDFIKHAAVELEYEVRAEPRNRFLGLPVTVGRVVLLPRPLTDKEWGMLVVDLRETFKAQGTTSLDGTVRQWHNGNLKIVVEPTVVGHQIRMQTEKGSARGQIKAGWIITLIGLMLFILSSPTFLDETMRVLVALFTLTGLFLAGATAIPLPGWARKRERQMEDIAKRTLAMMSASQNAVVIPEKFPNTFQLDDSDFAAEQLNAPSKSGLRQKYS